MELETQILFVQKKNPWEGSISRQPPLLLWDVISGQPWKPRVDFCPSPRPAEIRVRGMMQPLLRMSLPFCNPFNVIPIYLSPILRVVLLTVLGMQNDHRAIYEVYFQTGRAVSLPLVDSITDPHKGRACFLLLTTSLAAHVRGQFSQSSGGPGLKALFLGCRNHYIALTYQL